jgi:branched-chain amino acid transport system ATP-binding protein
MTPAIVAEGLVARFGGLTALDGVDLEVAPGEVVGVIGANGAGKTTLMNCICGMHPPSQGRISVNGSPSAALAPHQIARLGVGRTFQNPRVFRKMSLLDNLLVPVLDRPGEDAALAADAEAMLARMQLGALRDNYARELSGGQQKLLEMARLLMRGPSVVLLDEPFAGVHPVLCRFMIEQIRLMAAEGKAVLLISHDITSIHELAKRLVALHQGKVIAAGGTQEVCSHPAVIEAYLGA